ncbi:MAG: DUF2442 domain-containing protein [Elusimicrobia bacterium]|nr:DUF2442 domain-containing protein [Elusimicrobiota bacterium]
MNIPRIHEASAIDDHTLLVTFTNGRRKKYDVTSLLSKEMFAPLRSPAFFRNFHVEPRGYAIEWNFDIDISEHELWIHGKANEKRGDGGSRLKSQV